MHRKINMFWSMKIRNRLIIGFLLLSIPIFSIVSTYGSADSAQLAAELMVRGRYAEADSAYARVIEAFPFNATAIVGRIGAKIALKQYSEAMKIGLSAIKQGNIAANVYQSTAYAAYLTGDYRQACFLYKKAISNSMENSIDLSGIGWCYTNLKQDNTAYYYFKKAFKYDNSSMSAKTGIKKTLENRQTFAFGYYGTSSENFNNYLMQSGFSWMNNSVMLSYDNYNKNGETRQGFSTGLETALFDFKTSVHFHSLHGDYEDWYTASIWLVYLQKTFATKFGQFTPFVAYANSVYQTFSVYQFEDSFNWSFQNYSAEVSAAKIYYDSEVPGEDKEELFCAAQLGCLFLNQWQFHLKWETGQRDFVVYRDYYIRDNLDTAVSEISANIWWLWKPVNIYAAFKVNSDGEKTYYTGFGRYVKF